MQQQNQPQQQQLLRTQVDQSQKSENSSKQNTQTSMHIQIPLKLNGQRRLVREQSQNSHSPMEDLMDDISLHIFKSNQPMLQLLERLDMQCTFSRMYNKYSSSNDSQVWDSEVTLQSSFKIEAQIMEDTDRKQLAIKVYNEGQLSYSDMWTSIICCLLIQIIKQYSSDFQILYIDYGLWEQDFKASILRMLYFIQTSWLKLKKEFIKNLYIQIMIKDRLLIYSKDKLSIQRYIIIIWPLNSM
ncbi:hypothetical protein pb186bvf_015711 [Paramecium bursaria]